MPPHVWSTIRVLNGANLDIGRPDPERQLAPLDLERLVGAALADNFVTMQSSEVSRNAVHAFFRILAKKENELHGSLFYYVEVVLICPHVM